MADKPLSQLSPAQLLEVYTDGPQRLRVAIAGMSPEHINAAPIAGRWSTRQIICHLADCEPMYTDRMVRVIAEDNPTFFAADPDRFVKTLAYDQRDIEEQLQLIAAVRAHTARILKSLAPEAFERTGRHSADGEMTLKELLRRIANHIPHHVAYIAEKRRALGMT